MNYFESLNLSLDSLIGRNSVIAVAKLNTLEMALSAVGNGSEGYEKPNQAQTVNTRNITDNKYNEYFDILIKGDIVSSENVAISTRNRGRKVRYRYRLGGAGSGNLPIMIRSNGSSKIISPAAAPTMALTRAVFHPWHRLINRIMTKVTKAEIIVTGVIGLNGVEVFPACW